MSGLVHVVKVEVLDNPAPFTSDLRFQITFDCLAPGVKEELEWKLVYVGSADDEKYDQVLDSVLVGPVQIGRSRFVFEAPAPDPLLIPKKDILEVTVILLTCSYKEKEFVRIGYYVNNEYPVESPENIAPEQIEIPKITRNILGDEPRITRFTIKWDEEVDRELESFMQENQEAGLPVETNGESSTPPPGQHVPKNQNDEEEEDDLVEDEDVEEESVNEDEEIDLEHSEGEDDEDEMDVVDQ